MKTCVFAGSFDPFTIGHKEVVKKALTEYDFVFVAIGVNPNKTCYFTVEERLEIIRKSLSDLPKDRIRIDFFDGLLVDYVKQNHINASIRGIRNDTDLQYEKQMEEINLSFYSDLKTVYYSDIAGYERISSTNARENLLAKNPIFVEICESAKEYVKLLIERKRK